MQYATCKPITLQTRMTQWPHSLAWGWRRGALLLWSESSGCNGPLAAHDWGHRRNYKIKGGNQICLVDFMGTNNPSNSNLNKKQHLAECQPNPKACKSWIKGLGLGGWCPYFDPSVWDSFWPDWAHFSCEREVDTNDFQIQEHGKHREIARLGSGN